MQLKKMLFYKAVFAGALVGFGLNFLLNLLSLAIGLSIFVEKADNQVYFSLFGFSIFIISAIAAMFSAGWIAGRLAPSFQKTKLWGAVYGFLAWTLCFILTVILITNMLQFTYFHTSFTTKELIAIRISNDMPIVAETKAVNADVSKKTITLNAQMTFILFAIGAFSSCLGGYLGYQPKRWK